MNRRVFLIRNVAPEKYGGGEVYQIKLAQLFKKNGFDPYILTNSKKLLEEAKRSGIKVIIPPYIDRQNWSGIYNFLFPLYYIKISRMKRWYRNVFTEYDPGVINIQSRDDYLAATRIANKKGIKVIWTDHVDFRTWILTNVDVWYKNWIGKWILREAKKVFRIVFVTKYDEKNFNKIKQVKHLDNTVAILNGAVDEKNKYEKVDFKKHSFCYIGRITKEKGISELMAAFQVVKGRYPDVTLKIYGEGNRELIVNTDGVEYCGATEDPLRALAESEHYILPSYYEGLSLSLLDAMMMEKKIIATNIEGNKEVVDNGNSGLLIPAKEDKALAEAMIWMLEHKKDSEKMAISARKCYENKFNFEKIFEEKMLPLYNSVKEKK